MYECVCPQVSRMELEELCSFSELEEGVFPFSFRSRKAFLMYNYGFRCNTQREEGNRGREVVPPWHDSLSPRRDSSYRSVLRNTGPAPWGSYPQTCMVLIPFCPVGPTLFPALQECPYLNLTLHERKEQSSAPFTGGETEA